MAVFEGRWLPLSANWLTATMRETLSKSLKVRKLRVFTFVL